MSISNYGERYLDHKKFLKLCTDLEINSLGSGQNESWLEFLEKEKVFFPIRRVVFPISYLKRINSIRFDPSNPYYGKSTYCLPDRYANISKIKSNIENHGWRNLFHILDKKKSKTKMYLRNPKRTKFKAWINYKKFVGKFDGHEYYASIATHLYSYWQAYHFYEITKACTLGYVINVFDEEIRKELCQLKIPTEKIFRQNLPFNYSNIKGVFYSQSKNFEILSFYIQSMLNYRNIVLRSKAYKKEDRFGLLDKKSSSRYINNQIRVAKLTIKRYNFNISQSFSFLKFLCKKFEEYEKQKKGKLSQSIKNDINYLILLMRHGFGIDYDYINQKLGKVINDFKNTLDIIFPPMFAEERENVLYTLDSSLSSDLSFYHYENVSREEIELFLKFLDSNNLQLFYHSLGQINLTQFSDKSIYLHVFYLSLLLENVIKIIGRNSDRTELFNSFDKRITLKPVIREFFKNEKWVKPFFDEKKKIWEKYTKIDNSTNIYIRVKSEIASIKIDKLKKGNEIIKMFLVCGLARNVSAHEHSKVYNIDRETYLILMNNTVSAIWFTWKYAKSKGYISSEK